MNVAVWQGLFVLAVIAEFVSHYITVDQMMGKIRFVAMDSRDTFYVSSLGSFQDAKDIHAELARLAAETIFSRNPRGYDDPERIERLFNSAMAQKLRNETEKDSDTFDKQQIHQKFESGEIILRQVENNLVLVSVAGQVLRHGFFDNKIFDDSQKVTILLQLAINTDMVHNGKYPEVITNYDVRYK
jgi:hypothetical protein